MLACWTPSRDEGRDHHKQCPWMAGPVMHVVLATISAEGSRLQGVCKTHAVPALVDCLESDLARQDSVAKNGPKRHNSFLLVKGELVSVGFAEETSTKTHLGNREYPTIVIASVLCRALKF
eukprot:6262934-Amphidinium_carterae.2